MVNQAMHYSCRTVYKIWSWSASHLEWWKQKYRVEPYDYEAFESNGCGAKLPNRYQKIRSILF